MTRRLLPIIALAAALLSGLAGLTARPDPAYRPVLDMDFPDPFVLATDEGLFAYATNTSRGGRRLNVQASRSSDGRSWAHPWDAMPQAPAWARRPEPDIWAPEASRIGDRYVLYFSARHATRRRPDGLTLCVGAAVSDRPEGPFTPQPAPLTCGGQHGVIDASPFRDGADLWLYVKTDGNCCRTPIRFEALRLSPDGLAIVGDPTVIEGVTNDAAWEGQVVEAPQMVRHDGRYWLFYSGADYGGRAYAAGYALCDGPAGPCRDAPRNPILASTPGLRGLVGPGHPSLFQRDGQDWIAYHGWRRPLTDGRWGYRALYLDRVDWSSGAPVIAPGWSAPPASDP
jgi:beta-xylosidase